MSKNFRRRRPSAPLEGRPRGRRGPKHRPATKNNKTRNDCIRVGLGLALAVPIKQMHAGTLHFFATLPDLHLRIITGPRAALPGDIRRRYLDVGGDVASSSKSFRTVGRNSTISIFLAVNVDFSTKYKYMVFFPQLKIRKCRKRQFC